MTWSQRFLMVLAGVSLVACQATTSPTLSGTIAYTSRESLFFSSTAVIYVMEANGAQRTRLTDWDSTSMKPNWSPDGSRLAFVSQRDGNEEIYVMDADGAQQTRLTTYSGSDIDPRWSPDGTHLVFTSTRHGFFGIYRMDADGINVTPLVTNPLIGWSPDWSPDGRQIAFVMRDGVYVMDPNGMNRTHVGTLPGGQGTATPSERGLRWSPDGQHVVFSASRDGTEDIYLLTLGDPTPRRLTHTERFFNANPAWLPDGSQILFLSDRKGRSYLYIMEMDGSNQQLVMEENIAFPDWKP